MEVCVALGLLVAELAPGPFKNHVLTFESQPKFHKITGSTLAKKVYNLLRAPWGGSTNFAKAINMVLEIAIRNKVPQDQMPKLLFIFSDMQFDQAQGSYGGY